MKLLYIDAVYPYEWLEEQQKNEGLTALSFKEYREWLLAQRIYLSDYMTNALRENGTDCEEIIVNDPLFLKKLNDEIKGKPLQNKLPKIGNKKWLRAITQLSVFDIYKKINPTPAQRIEQSIVKAWEYYNPDMIFVREPCGINTDFWKQFKHRSLIVGLIGCNTSHPNNWFEHNFDVLVSITKEYYQYYKAQGITSCFFSYGVDERVYQQLQPIQNKVYDVVFVGLLGNEVQIQKTILLEEIAGKFNFKWWAPRNVDDAFPNLKKTYQGKTSGIAMLTIYRQAKIVVNDYVDTGNGQAVNLRLYEVLNVGSFILTRYAENLQQMFPQNLLKMYKDADDCVQRIDYYLTNENEREANAKAATTWALEHVTYSKRLESLQTILIQEAKKVKLS